MASSFTFLDSNQHKQESTPRKRRKFANETQINPDNTTRWRTETEQQIYSSMLVEALRHVQRDSTRSIVTPPIVRDVRRTADRILAMVARGRTRWSRAILANRINRRLGKHKKVRVNGSCNRLRKSGAVSNRRRRIPPVEKKVKELSRLVPGCWKIPFPNLLEETGDYIEALRMQIRAMTTLTQLLNSPPANRFAASVCPSI